MSRKLWKLLCIILSAVGLSIMANYGMMYSTRLWMYLLIWTVVLFAALREFLPLKKTLLICAVVVAAVIALCTPITLPSYGFLKIHGSGPWFSAPGAVYWPADDPDSKGVERVEVPVQRQGHSFSMRVPHRIFRFGKQWQLASVTIDSPQPLELIPFSPEMRTYGHYAQSFKKAVFPVRLACIEYPDAETREARGMTCLQSAPGMFAEVEAVPFISRRIELPGGQYDVWLTIRHTTVYGAEKPRKAFVLPSGEGIRVQHDPDWTLAE